MQNSGRRALLSAVFLLLATLACMRSQPEIVVITATAMPLNNPITIITLPATTPTPIPTPVEVVAALPREYVVQAGDTLSAIAAGNGVSIEALLAENSLIDPNILEVGQVLKLPAQPSTESDSFRIIADSKFVRAPGSAAFDVATFVNQQPGYVRSATDEVNEETLTAAQIIQRVSLEYSIDARLLLALLEYRSGWLTNENPSDQLKTYPMGAQASPLGFDRNGLYRQLTWTADQLNRGYYGWKYGGMSAVEFEDGTRVRFASDLNAATVGLQHLLAQYNTYAAWQGQISAQGFYNTYVTYFGDPFAGAVDPLVPAGITQPDFTLPFSSDETWLYTGGPHGGWGAGSAWAAIDFAPPDERSSGGSSCYLSDYWVTAVAPGVIARTDTGVVILDLDGDGDEATGWSILYLHLGSNGRIAAGTTVSVGDRLGRPSCEGGFSNGTHVHIARRYNGEWIPADCSDCPPGQAKPSFTLGGWTAVGLPNQEYQGYLVNGGQQRIAEQGRLTTENLVSWQ
jgi:LasA protease